MSPRVKTDTLTIRMKPAVKEALRRIAEAENRSIANMVEMMVLGYANAVDKGAGAAGAGHPAEENSNHGKARKNR